MNDPNAKTRRRQMTLALLAGGGIVIVAIGGLFLFDGGGARHARERPKTVSIMAPGTMDDRDAWRAQQSAKEKANETLIGDVQRELQHQSAETRRLNEQLKAFTENEHGRATVRGQSSFPPLPLETVNATETEEYASDGTANLPFDEANGMQDGLSGRMLPAHPIPDEVPRRELEMISFGAAPSEIDLDESGMELDAQGVRSGSDGFDAPTKTSRPGNAFARTRSDGKRNATGNDGGKGGEIAFMPAGSFVRVAMLNGIDAPTGGQAQSNPLPVAFHVLDSANLANKHKLDIRDCRFIAAAWGDLSSERMMGRTETLSCLINGNSVEMPVKGQVIGEDGKAGVRGRLVTKQGQLLANALFSGALSGIGNAFQQSATVTSSGAMGFSQTLAPNKLAQAGIGSGVGGAGQMLAQYYLKAADKLFPVIETDGGRTVEILITQGAVYKGAALVEREYKGLLSRAGLGRSRGNDD